MLVRAGACRERLDFTTEWKFALNLDLDFSAPEADDSDWRKLTLPHDWSIEGEFDKDNPASPGGGVLPGGWHRKTFVIPDSDRGKRIFIDFRWRLTQRVRCGSTEYMLGYRPNGYVSFRYDLIPYLNYGAESNVLAIKVNNSEQPNSRWYSGAGIYRNW